MVSLNNINDDRPYPANPMLMLLTGDNADDSIILLDESFGYMHNEYITIHLCEDSSAENDDIIKLANKTGLKSDSGFTAALDDAIRKTKSNIYFNNNDLTVCLFLDSGSINNPLISDICTELYELLNKAYYNHVCFDVYFLSFEEFVLSDGTVSKNKDAGKILTGFAKQEWVRYVYLLSDVNNKGQLVNDKKEIIRLMLDFSFLTNSLKNNENINRLQDILIRESEISKYFCIGQAALYPSEQETRQMIKAELLHRLFKAKTTEDTFPDITSVLSALYDEIRNYITSNRFTLSSVSSDVIQIFGSSTTNFDYLYLFFNNEPMNKMDQIEKECRNNLLVNIDRYWQQIDNRMFDFLEKSDLSFWNSQYEESIIPKILYFINRFKGINHIAIEEAHKKYISWKNRPIQVKKKNKRLAVKLLKQWCELQEKERACNVLNECIEEILSRVRDWQMALKTKREVLLKVQTYVGYSWRFLLQNCTPTQKQLLIYERKVFSDYLDQNSWKVRECCMSLNNLLRSSVSLYDIEKIIEPFIEKLFWEMKQLFLSWQSFSFSSDLSNAQINKLYTDLYHTVETDVLLNARMNLFNTESYICFYGCSCEQFVNYIHDQEDINDVLYFKNEHVPAKVLYFQNAPSDSFFLWN